jgi:hypothetical protein
MEYWIPVEDLDNLNANIAGLTGTPEALSRLGVVKRISADREHS